MIEMAEYVKKDILMIRWRKKTINIQIKSPSGPPEKNTPLE